MVNRFFEIVFELLIGNLNKLLIHFFNSHLYHEDRLVRSEYSPIALEVAISSARFTFKGINY
jgi:hypothetical protein